MAGASSSQSAVSAGDGADSVHQAFEPEGAAVGVGGTSAASRAFFAGERTPRPSQAAARR